MKKIEFKVLLFLVLILTLSGGITYLALNQTSKSKNEEDVTKMTVALVNEDQGARLDGTEFGFGDEFTKSIEKDNKHDWYVVSRGVAESGLENNAYNMMIVIPNDFSERALSIDAEAPEKIKLNYKINASGNSDVKAEAEKTASVILGDFNRRIIDVYFASVIGNLQDAQESVGTIVEKEAIYTNRYINAVHSPLEQYTAQFQAVQDNTQVSKESFEGLQEILNVFEDGLGDGVKTNEEYLTSFNELSKMEEANNLFLNNFSSQFRDFYERMNDSEVLTKLQDLESANKLVYDQFQKYENDHKVNIVSEAEAIQQYFKTTNQKLSEFNKSLEETFESELDKKVAGRLHKAFSASFEDQEANLNNFFKQPDHTIQENIKKQIAKLPTLKLAELNDLGLSDTSMIQLKNVIDVTKKYNREFGYSPNNAENSVPLSKQIKEIKNHLVESGVEVTDVVQIPATKKRGQEFTLAIPEDYEVAAVFLKLPGETEKNYIDAYRKHGKVRLHANVEGQFDVRLLLKLKKADSAIDVFQPVTWNWKMHQKNIGEADAPNPEPKPEPNPEPKPDPEPDPKPETNPEPEPTEDEDATENPEVDESHSINVQDMSESEEVDNVPTEENPEEGKEEEGDPNPDPEPNPEPEPEIPPVVTPPEAVTVTNNSISHKIMTPLTEGATGELIKSTANTVREYQRMLMLYDVYFGLNMEDPELIDNLRWSSLKDFAATEETSLYYLFNQKDIVEYLTDYVVGHITGDITEQVHGEVQSLQNKMNKYSELVGNADRNSNQMTNVLKETTEQANVMNGSLENTLQELAKWREASIELLDDQEILLTNTTEEQTGLIALDGQFSTLLMSSQSLADQAKGNLQSADGVYQTFDAIDDQARAIQKSGATLVTQADTLATNMTNKLVEDKNFADNFANVLENSRIGDRPNENLYSFLSNPVQTKNAGVITTGDTLTPYFLVLICFIVALFTAYTISANDQKRVKKDSFEEESTLIGANMPLTLITASIAIVEGLVIGIISGKLLNVSQEKLLLWIVLITLAMLAMLLVATYLLRQLKMIGMFVLLIMLSLYLFSTEALGSDFDKLSLAATVRKYSPLQYIESLLMNFSRGLTNYQGIIFILVGLALMALVANLIVIHRSAKKEGNEDEGLTESR